MSNIELKQWGFYLANIPYWDKGSKSFLHKARPIVIYNFSGGDVIALPVTSNQDENGKKAKEERFFEVSIKLEKFSLVKINKPITLSKDSIFKYFGIQADTKTRRQIKGKFKATVVLKEK